MYLEIEVTWFEISQEIDRGAAVDSKVKLPLTALGLVVMKILYSNVVCRGRGMLHSYDLPHIALPLTSPSSTDRQSMIHGCNS